MKGTTKLSIAGVGVLALIVGVSGCATTELIPDRELHEFTAVPLVGMIYRSDNTPCSGVSVELLRRNRDSSSARVITDAEGRFMLNGVKRGFHRVRLSRPGYQTMVLEINFSVPTDIFYAQLLSLEDLLEKAEEEIDRSRWQEAALLVSEAMVVDSLSGEALYLRAVVLAGQGRLDEATAVIDRMRKMGLFNSDGGGLDG